MRITRVNGVVRRRSADHAARLGRRRPVNDDTAITRWPCQCALAVGLFVSFGATAADDHMHDGGLLLLPNAQWTGFGGLTPDSPVEHSDSVAAVDVLITAVGHRLRFLSETLLATDDQEIERFQVGWDVTDRSRLWLGRFHQPSSAWNTEHHHGQYLQTAITRPFLERWEDEQGLIPQHIVGALAETRQPIAESRGISMALGVGAAPLLKSDELDPVHVVGHNEGHHRISASARLAYLPDLVGDSSVGVVFAHHELTIDPTASALLGASRGDLTVIGAYGVWQTDRWRGHATAYYLDFSRQTLPERSVQGFGAGYVQLERRIGEPWTLFGRQEASAHAADSPLVRLRPEDFALSRTMVGVRWDFRHSHALTVETAATRTRLASFTELRVQWSGVLQ